MSEIHPSQNRELYIELEMEELLEPQTFVEDPILGEHKGAPPFTEEEFIDFFKQREHDDSPTQGYFMVAESFVEDLHIMLDHLKEIKKDSGDPNQHLAIRVATRPLDNTRFSKSPGDEEWPRVKYALANTKPYESEETAASRAFRVEVEYLLHTRVLNVDSDDDPRARTLYSGRYYDRETRASIPLYMLERKEKDEKGEYTTLELRSHPPEDMVDASPTEPHYSEEAIKAIAKAKAMQKVSSIAIKRAEHGFIKPAEVEDELDYHLFVENLPVAPFESPYDQKAA